MLLQTLRCPPASAESDVMHVSTGLPGKPDHVSMHHPARSALCWAWPSDVTQLLLRHGTAPQ